MKRFIILFIAICALSTASAQLCSVRINALEALMGSINAGVDIALTDNLTADLSGRYNPIMTERLSLKHSNIQVGMKYWLYENFVGQFFASQVGYTKYSVGKSTARYDGEAYTFGLSGGYSWILATRWSLAVEAGVGLCYNRDVQSDPTVGDRDDEYYYYSKRLTLIPNRLGVTFSYLF